MNKSETNVILQIENVSFKKLKTLFYKLLVNKEYSCLNSFFNFFSILVQTVKTLFLRTLIKPTPTGQFLCKP